MCHVLGMNQVFYFCVLVMILLKVMDLIFILVISVMTWSEAEIRKLGTSLGLCEEGIARDTSCLGGIEDLEDVQNG